MTSEQKLSEKRKWFLSQMAESPEQERWGFELIQKRQDFLDFFIHLRDRGFFDAEKNPRPQPTDDGKYVQIPYWPALDYLSACAKSAGAAPDLQLAKDVLEI